LREYKKKEEGNFLVNLACCGSEMGEHHKDTATQGIFESSKYLTSFELGKDLS